MAYTRDQLRALEAAIALGVLEVQQEDGSRKRYRSLEEMFLLRSLMRQELGITTASDRRKYGSFSKGLE